MPPGGRRVPTTLQRAGPCRVLLAGHALRIAFALGGVDFGGPAATLLPDPDAMFLPDPAEPVPAGSHSTSLSAFAGSPADIPAVGAFDTVFHALLGVAYCRIRGRRLIAGAALVGVLIGGLIYVVTRAGVAPTWQFGHAWMDSVPGLASVVGTLAFAALCWMLWRAATRRSRA